MSSKLQQASRGRSLNWVRLIEIQHPDGEVRINTGYRNIDYDAGDGEFVWLGAGSVVNLELPEESGAIEVSELTLTLNGITDRHRQLAETKVRGNLLRIWIAFLDGRGKVVAAEMEEEAIQSRVALGRSAQGEESVTLYANGNFGFLARNPVARWTPEHQRIHLAKHGIDPDSDTGFDDQHSIPDANDAWYRP